MEKPLGTPYGRKIRELVQQLRAQLGGLTQEQLARTLSVTLRTAWQYEDPSQGPGIEGLVSLYKLAKQHGFLDLSQEFRSAAMQRLNANQEAERKRLALRMEQTDSVETISYVRKKLCDIYDRCEDALGNSNADRVDALEEIQDMALSMADRLFVGGRDRLIDGDVNE